MMSESRAIASVKHVSNCCLLRVTAGTLRVNKIIVMPAKLSFNIFSHCIQLRSFQIFTTLLHLRWSYKNHNMRKTVYAIANIRDKDKPALPHRLVCVSAVYQLHLIYQQIQHLSWLVSIT